MAKKRKEKDEKLNEAQEWLQKIQAGKKVKEAWREKFRIDVAYAYRDGEQRPQHIPESEWITVNKVYTNLKAELPLLYSNDPYYYIKLAKSYSPHPMDIARMEVSAKLRQAHLNYLKQELQLKPKSRVSILDAYFQYGVMKAIYQADIVENPDKGQPMTDDYGAVLMAEGEALVEPEMLPANECYKLLRIHPDDFIVDSEAGPTDDTITWLAQRIKLPLEDVQNDKKYEAAARKAVKPTEAAEDQVQKERARRKKGKTEPEEVKAEFVVLWEVYNLKKNEWFVVSEGYDDFMKKPDTVPAGIESHPFSMLRLGLLRDDSWYPVPPVSQWLDPQQEYNLLRSKILTHRKRFNRKYTMWRSGFADVEASASKLENGDDGTVLICEQPQQSVFPIQDASLDQNHIMELGLLAKDFDELATGANQRGAGTGIDSATEAGIIEKRVSIREGDNMSQVMDFITEIGRKLDQLVQANITRDVAIKIDGPEGEYWELVRETDYKEINGEYRFSVNTGATTPQLPEIERAQWLAFLGLLANAPQLALSKHLLKRMAEMHHIEDQPMIDEIYNIARQMMGGGAIPPNKGSAPGGPDITTIMSSITGGQAAGVNNIRGGA